MTFTDPAFKCACRKWFCKQEALNEVTALFLQIDKLFDFFHALGNHFEVQAVAKADDRINDCLVIHIDMDVVHKRTVDLDRGDRAAVELVQG